VKVAVTSSKDNGINKCLITNYNRPTLDDNLDFEREDENGKEMKIWEAAIAACFRADENQHRLSSVVLDCPGGPIPEPHSESSPLFCSGYLHRQGLRDVRATFREL
jgi:hypothetical protein